MDMEGKVAIITGASRGLGKAIALKYSQAGARVVVCARTNSPSGFKSTAQTVAKEIIDSGHDAMAIDCDVSNSDQVEDMIGTVLNRYGQIDVLVNNAGIMIVGEPFEQISPDRWDNLMNVNVRGIYLMCWHVIPIMKAKGVGSIINVGSNMGINIMPGGGVAYSSSKAAVHMMSYALAAELKPSNIAVNVFSPGSLKSEGSSVIPWNLINWESRTDPFEVAQCTVFLALQTGNGITGQYLHQAEYGKTWGPGISN
jgi:3-oxoacyl-[acyl-carrier protein] reductase